MTFSDLYDVIQKQQKVCIRNYFEDKDTEKTKVIYRGNIDLLPHSIYEIIELNFVDLIELDPHNMALTIFIEPHYIEKDLTYGKE